MKRSKKLTKKPDPADGLSETDGSDSEKVSSATTKKGQNKRKKAKLIKPEHSGTTEEKPKPTLKTFKGKGKKPLEIVESSQISDLDEASSKTKTKPKGKGNTSKLSKPAEDSSYNSDSETETVEKPSRPTKKGKGKKLVKKPEPVKEKSDSSDTEEKSIQIKRKLKNKRVTKPEQKEESSENSEPEKTSLPSKSGKGKGKGKKTSKTPELVEKSSDNSDPEVNSQSKGKTNKQKQKEKKDDSSDCELSPEICSDPEDDFDPERHKESLLELKGIDPDFYAFLEKHDSDLLNFSDHVDTLEEKRPDDSSEEEEEKEDAVHTPGELHGGSDESDFEDEDAVPIKGKVTLKMVKEWEDEMQKDGKMTQSTLIHVVNLFHAAVLRATSVDGTTEGEYNVAGSSVFNAILNMCVLHLPTAIRKYLGMEDSSKDPQECKHFVKIKGILIQYLTDALNLLSAVTSNNILVIMLKHLHQMSVFVACFPRISKTAIKRLINLWSSGEETVRVLAFVCILRITRNQQKTLLEPVLKAMFMTYVKNCKFVSPTTWPGINFMRRSLVEVYMLDLDLSYKLVFLYIRQLGIHLRNAIIVPKKENKLAVCNWQYMNSLRLWGALLQQAVDHQEMKSLLYPLSMIISHSIKLAPTPQYYPMRFFLTEILMDLARESGVLIPIFGFLIDVLYKFEFNKKLKKVSMKPLDFSCIIRLSKSQMDETGFKDAVVDRWYALTLEYSTTLSNTFSFPEVCVILTTTLGCLLRKITVPNYKKKLQQLLDKVEENANFIRNTRKSYKMSFRDGNAIRAWEAKTRAEGTPLMTFFENWSKLNKIQKRKLVTKNDELAGVMPLIKRTTISQEAKELTSDITTPVELFPSDSEDDLKLDSKHDLELDDEHKEPSKKKLKKEVRKRKKITQNRDDDNQDTADTGDIVQEFSAGDW